MTQLHHISLFILSLSLSLTTTLSLTFGLSPSPPVPSPDGSSELVTPKSTPSQPLTPQSTDTIGNFSNIPNTGPYKCSKTSPFAPARPFFGDCQSAIRLLPQDPTTGHFQYVENLHIAIPNPTPLTAIVPATLPTFTDFLASKPSVPAV